MTGFDCLVVLCVVEANALPLARVAINARAGTIDFIGLICE